MAVVREFYAREKPGEIESFALARDVLTDRVFIVRSKGIRRPELSYDEDKISIREFLAVDGAEQRALLDLIGTLVREE